MCGIWVRRCLVTAFFLPAVLAEEGFGKSEGSKLLLTDYTLGVGVAARGVLGNTLNEKWELDRERMQSKGSIWHPVMFNSDTILGKLQDILLGISNWLIRGASKGNLFGMIGAVALMSLLLFMGVLFAASLCACTFLCFQFYRRAWPYILGEIMHRCRQQRVF
jgi:hypothetical protein